MAKLVTITPVPVRVVVATAIQNIYAAIDAQEFDGLYLVTQVLSIEGGATGTIKLMTGMQKDSEDDWVDLFSNSANSIGTSVNQLSKGNFMRYLRWQATVSAGVGYTFWLGGVGRTYA